MNIKCIFYCSLLLFFLFANSSAFTQTLNWTSLKRLHGEGDKMILNHKIDAAGNHFVTGAVDSTLIIGTTTLSTNSVISFVAKLSPTLQPDWVVSIEDSLFVYISDLAIDQAGSTYVSGFYNGNFTVGSLTFNSTSSTEDGFLLKIDSQGIPQWLLQLTGNGSDRIEGVTVLPTGKICVAGTYTDNSSFNGIALPVTGINTVNNGILAEIDSSSTVQWMSSTNSTSYGSWSRIISAPGGDLFAVGRFSGEVTLENLVLNSQNQHNLLLARYSDSGNLIWAKQATGGSVNKIISSPGGNLLISGEYDTSVNFGTDSLPEPLGDVDAFLASYDSAGNFQWAHNLSCQNNSKAYGVATDALGNVYQTGFFSGTATPSGVNMTATNGDLFFLVYSPAGNLLVAQQSAPGGNDGGITITVDANNNLHLFGLFTGSFALPGSTVIQNPNIPTRDIFYASTTALLAAPSLVSAERNIQLFPNPAKDQVTLSFSDNNISKGTQLRLLSLTGQQVYSQAVTTESEKVKLHELPAGVYLVELLNGSQLSRQRLVIE